MFYLLSIIVGYLLGSIPTGYLLLKRVRGFDITEKGTGSIGAMNTFEVTNSKLIGVSVLLLDALKGLISVYIPILLFPTDFIYPAVSLLSAVFSHSYNPWLKFKGGRGLAAAAGGALLIYPFMLIFWLIFWIIIYMIKKDIHLGNIGATLFTLIIICLANNLAFEYSFPTPDSMSTLIMFSLAFCVLLITTHSEPIKEILKKRNIEE